MVQRKWGTLFGLRVPPIGHRIPEPRKFSKRRWDIKTPCVLRSFIKNKHVDNVQHLEIRGMHRDEILIERSRFPNFTKSLVLGTDGSLDEMECEYTLPSLIILFNDREMAHHVRQDALKKIGKMEKLKSWEQPPPPTNVLQDEALCNAVAFPYCVPRTIRIRNLHHDPLNVKARWKILDPASES